MDVRQYLSSKGFRWTERQNEGGRMAVLNCPFCDDKEHKFAISLEHGAYNCLHLNNCGVKGSWWDFQKALGDEPVRMDGDGLLREQPARKYVKPKPKVRSVSGAVAEFLRTRRISDETVKRFRLGQKDEHTLAIPYLKNGDVVQVKYRDVVTKKMWSEKDAEPVLFNRDACSGSRLILTEGEMDAMALKEYGITAASVPNGANDQRWIEHEWEWLAQFQEILLALDYDKAGQQAVDEVAKRLGPWRCRRVTLPHKDANDCLVNKVPVDTIQKCLDAAQDIAPPLLVRVEELAERVKALMENDAELYGVPTPFQELNAILRGWRPGEVTVWTGYNGSGKSTLLNQVVINLGIAGERSCVASLEMPTVRLLRWMLMQLGGPVDEGLSLLNRCVFFVNTDMELEPAEIFNTWEYAARKYGVRHYILDSLMRVSFPGKDELGEHKKFLSDLCTFAREYAAHVHLVAHPRKAAIGQERPNKADVGGTGHITNLAHNVLVLWRADEENKKEAKEKNGRSPADSVLYVVKNREWGRQGSVRLKFDEGTRVYREYSTAEQQLQSAGRPDARNGA